MYKLTTNAQVITLPVDTAEREAISRLLEAATRELCLRKAPPEAFAELDRVSDQIVDGLGALEIHASALEALTLQSWMELVWTADRIAAFENGGEGDRFPAEETRDMVASMNSALALAETLQAAADRIGE